MGHKYSLLQMDLQVPENRTSFCPDRDTKWITVVKRTPSCSSSAAICTIIRICMEIQAVKMAKLCLILKKKLLT